MKLRRVAYSTTEGTEGSPTQSIRNAKAANVLRNASEMGKGNRIFRDLPGVKTTIATSRPSIQERQKETTTPRNGLGVMMFQTSTLHPRETRPNLVAESGCHWASADPEKQPEVIVDGAMVMSLHAGSRN